MIAQQDPISWSGAYTLMICSGLALLAAGLAVIVIAKRAADGRLGPNGWAGIRTTATRSSEAAWLAAHQAGLESTVRGGAIAMITGVVSVPFAIFFGDDDPERAVVAWSVVLGIGVMATLGLVITGARKGNHAAEQAAARTER